jgi:hypothetical protein
MDDPGRPIRYASGLSEHILRATRLLGNQANPVTRTAQCWTGGETKISECHRSLKHVPAASKVDIRRRV